MAHLLVGPDQVHFQNIAGTEKRVCPSTRPPCLANSYELCRPLLLLKRKDFLGARLIFLIVNHRCVVERARFAGAQDVVDHALLPRRRRVVMRAAAGSRRRPLWPAPGRHSADSADRHADAFRAYAWRP